MVRRTKAEALLTRHRLLDAAEAVFHQRGVSRCTLDEIAVAAGLTRGAIHHHFKDKAGVFDAMMQRATMPVEGGDAACGGVPAPGEGPLEFIERRLVWTLRRMVDDAQTRRVFEIATHKVEFVDEMLALRDRHVAGRGRCLAQIERLLRAARRQGLIGPALPVRAVAMGLHALVDGLIKSWLLDPAAFDLLRVGRQAIQVHLAGLRAGASPPARVRAAPKPRLRAVRPA